MKLTEQHVSDERLNDLISWLSDPIVQRLRSEQDLLLSLLELKQRRAEDRQRENDGK